MLEKILGDKLKKNVLLRNFSTLKVGGKAKYFFKAEKIEDLIEAVLVAKKYKNKYLVLGSGSNVVIGDKGFDGLVILNRTSNISFLLDKSQVIVDSGVMLMRLIAESAENNLGGLETLFGIPGTIGGAIYGNAGANKLQINQFIKSLTLLDTSGKIIRCSSKWLRSGYRTTKIKQLKDQKKETPIILTAKLQLMPAKKDVIINKMQYWQKIRIEKQPYDKFTCGSVFKNPGDGVAGSAGYIIDNCGLKGEQIGNARVSPKHANFIENIKGESNADEIKLLINNIKQKITEEKKIKLEEEIEYIGE